MKKTKIGLLPLYIELYDQSAPSLRKRLEAFYEEVAKEFEGRGFDVMRVPFCRLVPEFEAAVKKFEEMLGTAVNYFVHYGNSSSIRLASFYARHFVYCNRGVNGIEGTLSTAAGCSVVADQKVFCALGDLSFFYDQNALWNVNLKGNLRVLLLNNQRGTIFSMLKGLEQSNARNKFVSGEHAATAEGICMQNNVQYIKATNMEELEQGLDTLINIESDRPVLLEVLTDPDSDVRIVKEYYKKLNI